MTEILLGIMAEAKKNKFSSIKENLSEEDVSSVWANVSSFIEKQMSQQKGVVISSLGTFSFTQKKLDVGNNKFILIQRPVFNISEKFAQSQGLHYVKHHLPGHIPNVQLNFAALSFESPYDRDTVEGCVREILNTVHRAVANRRNVELTFKGIGKLSIRDLKVKMKFYKEYINQMDGSGNLLESLQNRPGTMDSVMSDRCVSRAQSSNTIILPRITNVGNNTNCALPTLEELNENTSAEVNAVEDHTLPPDINYHGNLIPQVGMDNGHMGSPAYVSNQEGMEGVDVGDINTDSAIYNINMPGDSPNIGWVEHADTTKALHGMNAEPNPDATKKASIPSRTGSRMAAPVAMATGVSLLDDLVPSPYTPKYVHSTTSKQNSPPPGEYLQKPQTPHLAPLDRSQSFDQMKPGDKVNTPPATACGHPNAGQELCYLCHQRARRNIPVSFAEERRRRDEEEDRLLQQYQYMKDAENILQDQELHMAKRHNLQKMAAFNLGVSEAMHERKKLRNTDFQKSYIFQRRPLTPPRIIKQTEYSGDLAKQVEHKETVNAKKRSDEDFLERLEQVQLAEDLAIQREQFLKEKWEEQEKYKRALETQVKLKPLQVPAKEKDKQVFGKDDMTNEKMAERRRRAYELFQEQHDLVAQRKREAILKRLADQKEEEQVLERTKQEIMEDQATKYGRRVNLRKRLEEDWVRASLVKNERLAEDKMRTQSPGILLHEQCDQYQRCGQCKRVLKNSGESNFWSESRYIPGARLII